MSLPSFCAQDKNRTCTPEREHGPQPCASTNSATWAKKRSAKVIIFNTNPKKFKKIFILPSFLNITTFAHKNKTGNPERETAFYKLDNLIIMFTNKDIEQIKSRGIDIKNVELQIENFKKGFPYANLVKAATVGDGLVAIEEKQATGLIKYYDEASKSKVIVKFVPASGAASRMFKNLFGFIEEGRSEPANDGFHSVGNFFEHIKDFAFYEDLKGIMKKEGIDIEEKLKKGEYAVILEYLLNEKGLGYGKLPKGLLKFHKHKDGHRMPVEEHIVESIEYGISKNKNAFIHFTVSPEHLDNFKKEVEALKEKYEDATGVSFDISFSIQKPSTDTIAVDMDNNPFRDKDGNLVFRPGGHGALIENLSELDADLVFIKNIDNVVPDRMKSDTAKFKKVLGGLLLSVQEKTFKYLHQLENDNIDNSLLNEIESFANSELNITFPAEYDSFTNDEKQKYLISRLNRPIRVCGMVKNEGEPGGGPFWVKNSKGQVSLQIVESSQINQNDPDQKKILENATHFNPVDLVCGIKDYKGERFDLKRFVDPETGFISIKSKDGRDLKAQELPGLWNGAMADWITIFVEVPISTFNPVKTVNDLLRKQHQG